MTAIYKDLASKKVLVTGSTRGIGREIVKCLASQGCFVVYHFRNPNFDTSSFNKELVNLGAQNAVGLQFDMSDFEAMENAIKKFQNEYGPIESLVNNAGISKDQLTLRIKPEDVEDIININLKSTMVLTNMLIKTLMRQKNVSIVHMSSIVGLMGNASQTSYAASKAGLIGYSKSLAKELASRGLRSNVICPGFIQTEMTESLAEKAKESYLSNIPLGNFGQPSDVSNLCNFLLSDSSQYITGEVIKVDGGLYI